MIDNRMTVGGTWARTGLPQPVATATYDAANEALTFAGTTLTSDVGNKKPGQIYFCDYSAGVSWNSLCKNKSVPVFVPRAVYADGSTTTYTWDKGNRLTGVVDSLSGTITRAYDGLDRLTQETTPQGSVSYTYDAAGRRTGMTVTGQPQVTYTYDNANRLLTVAKGANSATYSYDAAGRRTSLVLSQGSASSSILSAYDAASQLTSLTYKQGANTIGTLTYGYDAGGNRTAVGGTWARTGLPQPVATATYDVANEALTFAGTTLTSDANGNVTSAADALGAVSRPRVRETRRVPLPREFCEFRCYFLAF